MEFILSSLSVVSWCHFVWCNLLLYENNPSCSKKRASRLFSVCLERRRGWKYVEPSMDRGIPAKLTTVQFSSAQHRLILCRTIRTRTWARTQTSPELRMRLERQWAYSICLKTDVSWSGKRECLSLAKIHFEKTMYCWNCKYRGGESWSSNRLLVSEHGQHQQ